MWDHAYRPQWVLTGDGAFCISNSSLLCSEVLGSYIYSYLLTLLANSLGFLIISMCFRYTISELCLPKCFQLMFLAPVLKDVAVFRDRTWREVKLKWSYENERWYHGLVFPYDDKIWTCKCTRGVCTSRDNHVDADTDDTARGGHCKLRRRTSEETRNVALSIWVFQSKKLWDLLPCHSGILYWQP